jgi:hypothetical protein
MELIIYVVVQWDGLEQIAKHQIQLQHVIQIHVGRMELVNKLFYQQMLWLYSVSVKLNGQDNIVMSMWLATVLLIFVNRVVHVK